MRDGFEVRDLGSTNGTYIDGEQVTDAELVEFVDGFLMPAIRPT